VEFLQPAGLLIPVAHHAPLSQHTPTAYCVSRLALLSPRKLKVVTSLRRQRRYLQQTAMDTCV